MAKKCGFYHGRCAFLLTGKGKGFSVFVGPRVVVGHEKMVVL